MILDNLNEIMGVNPLNFKRRLNIGISATIVVVTSTAGALIGTRAVLGLQNTVNSMLGSIFSAARPNYAPLEYRLISFILLLTVAFIMSIVYYVILPWAPQEEREVKEEGFHKFY